MWYGSSVGVAVVVFLAVQCRTCTFLVCCACRLLCQLAVDLWREEDNFFREYLWEERSFRSSEVGGAAKLGYLVWRRATGSDLVAKVVTFRGKLGWISRQRFSLWGEAMRLCVWVWWEANLDFTISFFSFAWGFKRWL